VLGEIAIRERNLLGRGQDVRLATTLSQRQQTLDFAFTEPYFLDQDLSAGLDLFHVIRDSQDVASFDSQETGFGLRLGFSYNEDWRHSLRYRFAFEEIQNVSSSASQLVQDEAGEETVSLFGQKLTFDKRNSRVDPTNGYLVSWASDVSGLGGTVFYLRNKLKASHYLPITDEIRLISGAEVGHIIGLDDDVRLNDRFFLGGDNLRGFEFAGAGPRDSESDDSLGGEHFASGSLELAFPLGLPEEFGISGALFTDMGYLSEVDDTSSTILDDSSVRASTGFGVQWSSPFGPIRVDFAKALLKEDFDETESFRFNFGTRF
jgi:outer membrane protein insertion porin family